MIDSCLVVILLAKIHSNLCLETKRPSKITLLLPFIELHSSSQRRHLIFCQGLASQAALHYPNFDSFSLLLSILRRHLFLTVSRSVFQQFLPWSRI